MATCPYTEWINISDSYWWTPLQFVPDSNTSRQYFLQYRCIKFIFCRYNSTKHWYLRFRTVLCFSYRLLCFIISILQIFIPVWSNRCTSVFSRVLLLASPSWTPVIPFAAVVSFAFIWTSTWRNRWASLSGSTKALTLHHCRFKLRLLSSRSKR